MKNVIIVEDVKNIREGLRTLIDTSTSFKCVDTFESFESFESKFNKNIAHIILIDIDLPGISGIEGIKKIKRISQNNIIIVLTVHEESERVFEAISVGASNYLVKNTPADKMINILEDAADGKVLMSSFIARKTMECFRKKNSLNKLNNNEVDILKKITEGNSLIAIEKSLSMSTDDIKTSFHNIYVKLFENGNNNILRVEN